MKTAESATSGRFQFGPFCLDPATRTLTRRGESVSIPARAFDVLVALAENPGRVLEKKVLVDRVWPDTAVEENNLAQSVAAIRRVLGEHNDDARYVVTVPGRGYCFAAQVTRGEANQEVTSSRGRRSTLVLIVAAMAVSVAGEVWLLTGRTAAPPRLVPLAVAGGESIPSFSPDGTRVVYWWRTNDEATSGLYVKVIGTGDSMPLVTGKGASEPAWSPDGRHIAYFRFPSGIYAIPALGGAERLIAATNDGYHAAPRIGWSPDSKRLAITDRDPETRFRSIWEVSFETGERRRLTTGTSEWGDRGPAYSPDGKTLAFLRAKGSGGVAVHVMPAVGGEPRRLTAWEHRAGSFDWMPDGREIVYGGVSDGVAVLWRIPVSQGEPKKIAEAGYNAGTPAVARSGNRLAFVSGGRVPVDLWRMEIGGSTPHQKFAPSTRRQTSPTFSPDGTKVAFSSSRSGRMEIWTADADGKNLMQITPTDAFEHVGSPQWSPDGREIAFDGRRDSNADVYVAGAQGGAARRMTASDSEDVLPSFSRDGRWVYFSSDRGGAFEIWKTPRSGGDALQVTKAGGVRGLESADGNLYYVHPRLSGLWRIPLVGGKEEKAFEGSPNWKPGMWRVYYGWWMTAADGIIYVEPQPVNTRSAHLLNHFDPKSRSVTTLAELSGRPPLQVPAFTVSPDGRTVVYTRAESEQRNGAIMLLENFR